MDNYKSYDFTFLYLINKCILLFKYIDIYYQKEILYDIKIFINKLEQIFSNGDFKDNNEKKNKILEILISYFEKIINEKIYNLINNKNKDKIITDIEKKALSICESNENKNSIDIKQNKYSIKDENNLYDLEQKLNTKIKLLFSDIEKNIKSSLKEYFLHTECVEFDLDKKFNAKLDANNLLIENKIKDIIKNNNYKINDINSINEFIKFQINDVYEYINKSINDIKINQKSNNLILNNSDFSNIENNFNNKIEILNNIENNFNSKIETLNNIENNFDYKIEKLNIDIKENLNKELENKIILLGNIFNENIQKIFNNLNTKITDNEKDLLKIFDEKLNTNEFNKNNFNIIFDKDNNEIKLLYNSVLLSSSKINIKGLIGPKGPTGNKGDKGETPIIRKIKFTPDNKLKFIVQENSNIYEIISDENIPSGPQGIKGDRGDPGKCTLDLKWNQNNVMRIDDDNNDSLIFLKSLCVGEKSHCLKNNSLSIGGGVCYNNNSLSIGNNAKSLDSDSISLYGSTIGKNAFSYRADNVDENSIIFGKKDLKNYNINSFNIISKEINFECDIFNIKTNKFQNSKINELEEKIIFLEKKITDILKKI